MIPKKELQDITKKIFLKYSVTEEAAEAIADVLVHANLRGVDSHGVLRVEHYIKRIQSGGINPAAQPRVTETSASTSVLDGDNGFGHYISKSAMDIAIKQAEEAFLRLKEDELLTVLPQRGSFVALIDLDHVEEARFLREQAEAGIIRLACEQFSDECLNKLEMNVIEQKKARDDDDENTLYILDKEFHRLLAEGADKRRVWKTIQKMDTHSMRLRKLSIELKLNWKKLVEQHEAMVEAIKEKNQKKAEDLIRAHLALLIYDQKALKDRYPDYFGPHVSKMYGEYDKNRELGHFFMAIDPAKFVSIDTFTSRLDQMIQELRETTPGPNIDKVYIPGELEMLNAKKRGKEGIPLPDSVLAFLKQEIVK